MATGGMQHGIVSSAWGAALAVWVACATAPATAADPVVLRGHAADVFMAAFTPDGGRVVTASADETARLWDAVSAAELRRFEGHTGPVSCLAVSGDGRTLVTGAQDNSVRVWSLPLPGPRVSVPACPTGAAALLLLPDGRTAVTAGGAKGIKLWRIDALVAAGPDRPAIAPMERVAHDAPVVAAAASADGATFATADETGRIVLWSPLVDEPLGSLGLHLGGITALAFHPDGQRLLSTGRDGTLRVWSLSPQAPRMAPAAAAVRDLAPVPNQPLAVVAHDDAVRLVDTQSLQTVRELARPTAPVAAVSLAPDATVAALADTAGAVRLVQLADGADRGRIAGHDGAVHDVAFLPDGKGLVTAGADGTVRRFALPALPTALAGHGAAVRAVASAPSGQWFASAGDDRTVRVWNPAGQTLRTLGTHAAAVQALAVAPDEKLVTTGDAAGTIGLWSAADGAAQGAVIGHRGGVAALAVDRSGSALWSSGADGTLKRWRLPIVPPKALAGHSQPIRAAAASADGRVAVTGGQDQSVRMWDATSGQSPRTFGAQPAGAVSAVALSPDAGLVAAVTDTGVLRVWKGADGAELLARTLPGGPLFDVAFLGAGVVATLGHDNVVRLWDPAALPGPAPAPESAALQAVAVSRDGGRVAVAGAFGGRPGVILRDRATGQAIGTFTGPSAPIQSLALSRDGAFVAAAAGATVSVWAAAGGEPTVLADLPAAVSALALADDGRSCHLAFGDAPIRHWSLAEKKETGQLAAHGGPVRHLLLDGATLVSAGDDGAVIAWDVAAGTPARAVPLGAPVRALDVAPGGRIAAATTARTIHLWSPADASPLALPALPQEVTSLRWSPDGRSLAVTSPDAVRILQADGLALDTLPLQGPIASVWRPDARGLSALRGDGGAAALAVAATHAIVAADPETRLLAAAPGGTTLVASGAGRRLLVRGVDEGRFTDAPLVTIAAGPARVTDLAFAADGGLLAAAGEDGRISVWDAPALSATDAPPRVIFQHGAPVRGVALDGGRQRRLAVAADDGVVTYDLDTGKEAERMAQAPGQSVVVATAAGTWVTGGQDGSGRLWTPALERMVRTGDAPGDLCGALVALPGDAGVAAPGGGPGLRRWLADGTPAAPLFADTTPVRLAATVDGTRIAVVDAAGALRVWRAADGAVSGPFAVGPGPTALALTPDGTQVVVGDAAPRLRAFSTDTGRLVEEAVAAAPVTTLVVTGTSGRQWASFGAQPQGSLQERGWVATWETGGAAVEALAVAADGARLFAGRSDGAIWQIALAGGAVERTLSASAAAVHELALEPSTGLLAAAGEDGLRLWALADGTLARQALGTPARRVAFVGAKRLATADARGLVELRQTDTLAPLEAFAAHPQGAAVVRATADGQTILSAGADGRLAQWRGGALASIRVAPTALDAPVPGGGTQVFVADGGGAVRVVDVGTGTVVRTLSEGLAAPLVLAQRPDGARLAIGSSDGVVRVVNPGDGAEIVTLAAEGPVAALAWRADGQRLAAGSRATGGAPPRIVTFGPPAPGSPQGKELVRFDALAPSADVVRLAWDRDGRDVWGLHADGALARWAPATPAPLFKLDHGGPVLAVVVSRDGETIVSGGGDQSVRVWDAATGQQRAQMSGHTGAVHALAFTPDEALVVSAGADRTLRLWDVAGGRQLKQLATTEETVYALAVHPAGQTVAAGGADRSVHLLNIVSGAIERTLAGHGDFVHGVAFNPAGTTLLSYGYAGELRIWGLAAGTPLLDTRVGRIGDGAAFDARGERVVVANGDGTATVIEVPAGAR